MKPQDLMIDDWVQVQDACTQEIYFCQITKLVPPFIYFNSELDCVGLSYDCIFPIPLTPEILRGNGFVYSDLPFEQSWQQFGLSLYRGGDGYRINCGENVAMIIDYVHQLQHALRLCGIEKEIVL